MFSKKTKLSCAELSQYRAMFQDSESYIWTSCIMSTQARHDGDFIVQNIIILFEQ